MALSIGIDIGWSKKRCSCALAIRGPVSPRNAVRYADDVTVGLFRLDDLIVELVRLATEEARHFGSAFLVIDGPVGPNVDAVPTRRIDSEMARGSFFNRAPGYPITQGSGLELANATSRALHALEKVIPVRPWLCGTREADGLTVAETNPTPAMALLLPRQDIASLPSRKHPKYIEGDLVRAKSDWYWRIGAGRYAAKVLGDDAIASERNHERVAGLFALALASVANSSVVALGDRDGIYVVPADIDASWEPDVRRVGLACGSPRFADRAGAVQIPAAISLDLVGEVPDDEDPTEREDAECVVLNDNGGLNARSNPWLLGLTLPCALVGPGGVDFMVTETFRNRSDMYKMTPSALEVARRLGFAGNHLSTAIPKTFLAEYK